MPKKIKGEGIKEEREFCFYLALNNADFGQNWVAEVWAFPERLCRQLWKTWSYHRYLLIKDSLNLSYWCKKKTSLRSTWALSTDAVTTCIYQDVNAAFFSCHSCFFMENSLVSTGGPPLRYLVKAPCVLGNLSRCTSLNIKMLKNCSLFILNHLFPVLYLLINAMELHSYQELLCLTDPIHAEWRKLEYLKKIRKKKAIVKKK